MIVKVKEENDLFLCLDKIGLKSAIDKNNSVAIKVNLARPPQTTSYLYEFQDIIVRDPFRS